MTRIDESKQMLMAGGGYKFYKWRGPTAGGGDPICGTQISIV